MSISLTCLFAFLLGVITTVNGNFEIQILHNSDIHARFEQTNAHSEACSEEEARLKKCYGGIARIKTAIKQAIKDVEPRKIPTLVLNAGDFFVGSPYYTLKKWELVVPLVDALEFDAATIGNHDFDDGIQNLVEFINHVKVPLVSCNLELKTEPRLERSKLKSSIVLNVEGTDVGIIGSVTPWTREYSQTEKLNIFDEIPSVQAEARKLKDNGVKIIILLSHSEFNDDKEFVKAIPELSLIVGSHSHTFLYTPKDKVPDIEEAEEVYPYMAKHPSGKVIPIVHAYAFTKYLGKLIVVFDDDGNAVPELTYGNPILLNASIPEDEEVKKLVEDLIGPLREEVKSPFAFSRVPLLPADFSEREFESTLANLCLDAMLDHAVQRAIAEGSDQWTTASIGLLNIGGYFHELGSQGRITPQDMMDTFRNGNFLFEVTYLGSVIKEGLEYGLVPKEGTYHFHSYLHVSGMKVVYDLSKPVNHRVVSMEALCTNCIVPRYEKMQMDKPYRVVLPRFMWEGEAGYKMFNTGAIDALNLRGVQLRDVVEAYLKKRKIVYPFLDGRVIVKHKDALVPNVDMKDAKDELRR